MRLPVFSSPGAMAAVLFAVLLADLISARPSPEPKVPARVQWSHNRGKEVARNALRQVLDGRTYTNATAAIACSTSQAISITAPLDNVWAGLSDAEAVSVVAWLFGQESLNLTETEDAGEWDNTV